MPLSLNDIQKKKSQKKRETQNLKAKKITKTPLKGKKTPSKKTKPWEKTEVVEPKEPFIDRDAPLVQRAFQWGQKIKVYPKISIPVPSFFLSDDKNDKLS